ncbi:MAG: alpha/beta hydrolase [Candidatus Zixiibacteriota bacterium]|nr:MAG: alpha/beta hydrolase [candidate division Zixibacteria bacterium]
MIRSAAILLLSLLLILGACQKQADKTEIPQVVVDSVASADGVMIHYKSYGENDRAVVFVHGWSCDGSYWVRQVEAFKDEYQVVTIDLAGHGNSGADREEWTMGRFGDDVAAVVNSLGLKEVILVGHSMGGAVCIEASRRLPQKVIATVGADTYQDLSRAGRTEESDAFIAPFRQDFVGTTRGFVRGMFGPDADTLLVEQVVEDMSQADSTIGLACFEGFAAYDFSGAMSDMRKPVRAINADMWPTDVEGNQRVAESFEVDIIEGIGHFVQLEAPEEFNVRLRRVLHEFWPPEPS